jgi:hypothetical protein
MLKKIISCSSFAVLAGLISTPSHAGEVYLGAGLPGVMLGYAHAFDSRFGLRVDISTLGTHSGSQSEGGIDYEGTLKTNRSGLYADWFVSGGWRFTGGVTFNNFKLTLVGRGNGGTLDIGGKTTVTTPDDRFDVLIEFPKTTPYIGVGYGHHAAKPGWGVVFDVGASIGRAKVTGSVSGPNVSGNVTQADIDRELEEVRDGVGKIRAVPQLSLGVNYRF